jgi:hypothetical protein
MRPPPAARIPANDGRGSVAESGPRRSVNPSSGAGRRNDFIDYAESRKEDTTTSQRPMDAYEQWLSDRFAEGQDADEATTAAEVEPPVRRRESGVRNREPSMPDPYRDAMPTALEVDMNEAPPTMERSEPWQVPVEEEPEPREYQSGETRMRAPRGLSQNSDVSDLYAQKIPPAPAVPRIATPFGGFNQRAYAQPSAPVAPVPAYERPSYDRPAPAYERPSYDRQSYDRAAPLPLQQRAMHVPSMSQPMAPMQMPQLQHMQQLQAMQTPRAPQQPLLTQVVTANGPQKEVHRAPWFCLGLAVGVISMVIAFFMPASRTESVASAPLPTMQITPPAQPQQQQAMQPPVAAQPPMQQPMQMQPMQPGVPAPQVGTAMPLPPATQVVPPPAQASIGSSQKLPTVDVRSLPVAGAKAQAPAPRRPQYAARPQAPRRPAAPPPKPAAQDDDDAPAERAPQAAPKPAPAQQAQDTSSLAADTLLQAL